jgi:hypothetical protein
VQEPLEDPDGNSDNLESRRRTGALNLKGEPEWNKNKVLQQLNYIDKGKRLELYHILEKYKTNLTSKPGK